MPDAAPVHVQTIFRLWQQLAPEPLPPKKEAQERKAAARLARCSQPELQAATEAQTQAVLLHLRQIKIHLTHNCWADMLNVAHELKSHVHSLRVGVRARNLQTGAAPLPPRAAQYQGIKTHAHALAWANALDTYMLQIGREPGPLISLWNTQCCVVSLPPIMRAIEQAQSRTLVQDRQLLDARPQRAGSMLRDAQNRKQNLFSQGLLLDEIHARTEPPSGTRNALNDAVNYARITQAVGRLRASVQSYQHATTPLPPHPEQYTMAGNSWATNRRHWRQAMRDWLGNVDETYPPEYTSRDRTLPTYRISDTAAPPYRMHWRMLPGPWKHWPRFFPKRARTI